MALCWMYTLRSVSCLVLKRGGRELLFLTFTPIGRSKSLLVPLQKVSAVKQAEGLLRTYLLMCSYWKYCCIGLELQGTCVTNHLLFQAARLYIIFFSLLWTTSFSLFLRFQQSRVGSHPMFTCPSRFRVSLSTISLTWRATSPTPSSLTTLQASGETGPDETAIG